jgi:ParB family chromosome partitioning protein
MVRSVKEMGILLPIIVRPIDNTDNEQYEILSGHNRVNAAKAAGLNEVPVNIKRDLSDEEAELIVTETNLVQRSFADLSHSERAIALKHHMDAINKQGKRNDLINEINSMLNPDKIGENETSDLIGQKLYSRDKTADKYGLSSTNVARYIRLIHLDKYLQDKVDNDDIGLYAAVSLSYLSAQEQTELNRLLDENKYKINIKKAELIREFSANKKLNNTVMEQILSGEFNKKSKSKTPAQFVIKQKIYKRYFDETKSHTEVESIIVKALEEYFAKYENE